MTRAQPGADATAERLRDMGHDPVVAPMLAVEPIAAEVDLAGVVALAFTSANAVRAFAGICADRTLPVFCVGAATAQAAHEAGFGNVASANRDVAALADLIARAAPQGVVLNPTAEEPSKDFVSFAAQRGFTAQSLPVYRTMKTGAGAPAGVDAILIHSAKAAREVAKLVAETGAVSVFGISEDALAPLAGLSFLRVATAPEPNEDSLLGLLDERADEPRALLGPAFWVVVILSLLCVLAGPGVAIYGPKLYPPAPRPAVAPLAPASGPSNSPRP